MIAKNRKINTAMHRFNVMILICPYLFPLFAISQLDLKTLENITLGEQFINSKPYIKSMFKQEPKIMKADFLGAYKIEYENTPFNYYGNADYTFQYVKDKLVAIKLLFSFEAKDTMKFRRLYKTLINDLNNDQSKDLLKQHSDLNEKKVFDYIKAHCRTTTSKNDINYVPIELAFLGQNFWAIYSNGKYTGKFIRFFIHLSEIHSTSYENGIKTSYDGAVVQATMEITNEQLQDLKGQEEEMEISNYKTLEETSSSVKLKFQNGVYIVPINLNGILSLDFVLDLGASDVSISPDIFLVLYRAGTIQESDFIGTQTYQFADGSTAKSNVFNIKTIKIGDKELQNVRASISNSIKAPLLLGQSALKKLNGYKIDNENKMLIIE